MIIKTLILLLVYINLAAAKSYRNYTLYRTIPVNTDHLKFFENLPSRYDVNYWREPGALWKPIEFIISPKDRYRFLSESDKNGIYLTTLDDDVQSNFDKYVPKPYVRSKVESFGWTNYHTLDDINVWLHDLTKKHPDLMSFYSIGETAEKRPIMVVRIHYGKEAKPAVVIEGGMHAREWISVAFTTYVINELVIRSTDEVRRISAAYDFYIIPVMNPDGYAFTHQEDRLWRKNRNYDGKGVDLNRNFDIMFGKVGTSHDKDHMSYCGPTVFSEGETRALKKLVEGLKNNIKAYLSFHAYGQAIIIPYMYSEEHEDFYKNLEKLGTEAVTRLYKRYQTAYRIGTSFETVGYKASGASLCWVKKNFNVPLTFLFALRDKGRYGFGLPPQYIKPTCQETFDAVLTILNPKAFKISKKNLEHFKNGTVTTIKVTMKSPQKKATKKSNAKVQLRKKQTKKTKGRSLKNAHNVVEVNVYLLHLLFFVKTFVFF